MRLILSRPIEMADRHRILTDLGLEGSVVQDEPGRAYAETWLPDSLNDNFDIDDQTVINYVDDRPIGVRYFVVAADESWVQRIRQSFPILTDDAVFERARAATSDQERIEATYMIALIGGREPDQTALAEMKASLHHPSEEVRSAAILAVSYTTWAALEQDLMEMAAKDGSPEVRNRAQILLEQIAVYGWEE